MIRGPVPNRVILRCEFCSAAPGAEHRGDLTAYLREHYGTIAPHPWKCPPYPTSVCTADTERAIRFGGLSGMPKWGLG